MSAVDTVERVLRWAQRWGATKQPPPSGRVSGLAGLVDPPDSLCRLLPGVTARAAARLRLPQHPCGDSGPIGIGSLIIAAAVATAHQGRLPRALLGAVPAAAGPREWIARHAVVAPALPFLPIAVADDCRLVSPLTALLDRPAPGGDADPIRVARILIGTRAEAGSAERTMLVMHLAQPSDDYRARVWRTEILDRLHHGEDGGRMFVLDVYEATMIHHCSRALSQVRAARRVLTDPIASADEQRLNDARSVAGWWGPLASIERTHIEALRRRRYIDYDYREGVALARLARRLAGGVVS